MTTQTVRAGGAVRIAVDAPSVTVGETTTLPAGYPATVTNIGTDNNLVLAFMLFGWNAGDI